MKTTKKKLLSIFMVILVTFMGLSLNVNAESDDFSIEQVLSVKSDAQLMELEEQLQYASDEELQEIINMIGIEYNDARSYGYVPRPDDTQRNLKIAWLAAAEIAKRAGYTSVATLVKHSVHGIGYSETNGIIARKIKNTSLFNTMLRHRSSSETFTKDIDKDLYYSLHTFEYYVSGSSQGARVHVLDTFDFHEDQDFGSLFANIVNDWGLLNQNLGVLNRIPVNIDIDV